MYSTYQCQRYAKIRGQDAAAEDGTALDCTAGDGTAEDGTAELSKKGGRSGGIT